MEDATERWRRALAAWAIPEHVLAAAPVSPWGFSVAGFADRAERQREQPTPAHTRAREAVPEHGHVLDVGCGGGAASLPLVPPAVRVTGVDESEGMLAAFGAALSAASADVDTVLGRWPDVASVTPVADVVVCQDVFYNVAELRPFVAALTAHARHRVVAVLPTEHPLVWTNPYWEALWELERPDGPTIEDAVAVVTSTGVTVNRESFRQPTQWHHTDRDTAVADVRRRLCLPESRDPEIRRLLERVPPPVEREAWAIWWDLT